MGSTRRSFGRYPPARPANAMVGPFALAPCGAVMLSTMFALSDDQLALVMTAAGSLLVQKRSVLLERVAARLRLPLH